MFKDKIAKEYAYVNQKLYINLRENLTYYLDSQFNSTVFEYNGNLFDMRSLNRPVNLDCMNCHLAHTRLCCDGAPFPPLQEDLDKIEIRYDSILFETLPYEEYLRKKEFINEQKLIDSNGSFVVHCGKCIFSTKLDNKGTYGCGIHAYALKNNVDYTSIKPRGCMMYPIDVIKFEDGSEFIFGADDHTVTNIEEVTIEKEKCFAITKDNLGFSRWTNHDLEFICLNKYQRKLISETRKSHSIYTKGSLPDNTFKLNKYKPAYVQERNFLISLYGLETYKFIENMSQELLDGGIIL